MTRGSKRALAVAASIFAIGSFVPPNIAGATSLTGDSIQGFFDFGTQGQVSQFFPGSFSTNPFIVDGTVETIFSIQSSCAPQYSCVNVNFNESSVILSFINNKQQFTPAPFNGLDFRVSSGNPYGTIASVSIPVGRSVTATATLTDLYVNLQGQTFNAGDTVTINFDSLGSQGVPGPIVGAGLPGMGFAVGAVLVWWRRRNCLTI